MKRNLTTLRAFSLLEVMVAVAILGLLLSVILSAQGGLAASNRSAANMGMAADLGRCKMTEIEEKLLRDGYPEIDAIDTDVSCCVDADREGGAAAAAAEHARRRRRAPLERWRR
jgi:general secretion pathway protein I